MSPSLLQPVPVVDPENLAMQHRREEMFVGEPIRFDGSTSGNSVSITVRPCKECGVLVIDENAHFGFHCKIDNIDQRLVRVSRHTHSGHPA
jgi:hypothetical protein